MKAIANSIEPMGIEPGLFPRAVRPVTGLGFEQLFSGLDGVIAEGAVAVEAGLAPPLAKDAQALPAFGPFPARAVQAPLGLEGGMPQVFDIVAGPAALSPDGAVAVTPDGARLGETDVVSFDPALLTAIPLEIPGAMPDAMPGDVPAAPDLSGAMQSVLDGADHGLAQTVIVQMALLPGEGTDAASLSQPVAIAQPHPDAHVTRATSATALPGLAPIVDGPQPPLTGEAVLPVSVPHPMLGDLAEDGAGREPMVKQPVLPVTARVEPGEGPVDPAPQIPTEAASKAPTFTISPVAAQLAKAAAREVQPALYPADPEGATITPGTAATETLETTAVAGPTPRNAAMAAPASPLAAQLAKLAIQNGQSQTPASSGAGKDVAARNDALRFDPAQAIPAEGELHATGSTASRAPLMTSTSAPVVTSRLPMAGILNMRESDWGKSFVAQIERMTAAGAQRIEISLRPKNLGEIQVSLDLRGDQTQVHIVTETAAAARLLGGAEDRLAQMLDQSGYRLSGFSAQDHDAGGQQGQNSGQQGQHAPRRNRPATDTSLRDEPGDASAAGPHGVDRVKTPGINMLA